jgi:hypothetical protein
MASIVVVGQRAHAMGPSKPHLAYPTISSKTINRLNPVFLNDDGATHQPGDAAVAAWRRRPLADAGRLSSALI